VSLLRAGLTAALLAAAATPAHADDPARGQQLYESRCIACHSLDANRVGPMHRGVYGRKAGSVPGFAYSPALRASLVVWSAATLDRWLTDPQSLIPGQRMNFRVALPEDRADIIAYLKQESGR
jgi:cytochrome c